MDISKELGLEDFEGEIWKGNKRQVGI